MNIYTIFDSAADCYNSIFLEESNGAAIRQFALAANDAQSMLCKFPGDFTLFKVGEWDKFKGKITVDAVKTALGTAIEFKEHQAGPPSLPGMMPEEVRKEKEESIEQLKKDVRDGRKGRK